LDFSVKAFIRCVSEGDESLSFAYMHDSAKAHTGAAIFYMHSKGSYSPSSTNTAFRRALMRYVVDEWRECFALISSGVADTCGMRLSPFPHVHYPGNMWWASSAYIATLVPPHLMTTLPRFPFDPPLDPMHCPNWAVGRARFGSERWIASSPHNRAFDCLRNHPYAYGYVNLPDNASELQCARAPRSHLRLHRPGLVCYSDEAASCLRSMREFGVLYAGALSEGSVGDYVASCAS